MSVEVDVHASCSLEQKHVKVRVDLISVWGWYLSLTAHKGHFIFPPSSSTSPPIKDIKRNQTRRAASRNYHVWGKLAGQIFQTRTAWDDLTSKIDNTYVLRWKWQSREIVANAAQMDTSCRLHRLAEHYKLYKGNAQFFFSVLIKDTWNQQYQWFPLWISGNMLDSHMFLAGIKQPCFYCKRSKKFHQRQGHHAAVSLYSFLKWSEI